MKIAGRRMQRYLCLPSVVMVAACANAPVASDGGVDRGTTSDGGGATRVAKPAPADFAPEDWVLFQCPSCAGASSGLRAVRCDGSEEILLGAPSGATEMTGARLTEAFVAASVRNGTGWDLWTRKAGAWQMIALGSAGAGDTKVVGGPHVEGHFSGRSGLATRIVYARSYDTGTDAVSYFDVALGVGYDFIGQALPQVDDLQIQFAMLGDDRVANYWFSPSGQVPGNLRQLQILNLQTGRDSVFALDKPDQIAGMRDGSVAVLRDGAVTTYAPSGAVDWTLAVAGRVTAIAAVDSGALAFSSSGDLYCARSPTDVVRLTDSPADELLFP